MLQSFSTVSFLFPPCSPSSLPAPCASLRGRRGDPPMPQPLEKSPLPAATPTATTPTAATPTAATANAATPTAPTPTLKPQLALKREPSPATLHSLLHGSIVPSPRAVPRLSTTSPPDRGSTATYTSPPDRGSTASYTSPPDRGRTGLIRGSEIVPVEGCKAISESPDLFDAKCNEQVCWETGASLISRAARTLTYETEDPFRDSVDSRQAILRTPSRGIGPNFPEPSKDGSVVLSGLEPNSVLCLMPDPELSLEDTSASMAAFVLSTPTKVGGADGGRSNFRHALESFMD